MNDTTNSLTTRIIFGKNRNPQSQFYYRDLSKPVFDLDRETYEFLQDAAPEMMEKTEACCHIFRGISLKTENLFIVEKKWEKAEGCLQCRACMEM